MGSLTKIPEQLRLSIGAICGPTFAIIDGDQLDHEQVCYRQVLQGIPECIVPVGQVLVIFRPEQLRQHQPCSSDQGCQFQTIDLETLPDAHFILRSWFPPLTYQDSSWREASVSIGGLLVAGKYVHQKSRGMPPLWKFACWSQDWSQEEGSWEQFDVAFRSDEQYCVTCYRQAYQASPKVYDESLEVVKESFLEQEREELLKRLQSQLAQTGNPAIFPISPAHQQEKGGEYRLDIAFIPDQSGLRNNYQSKFLIVPFIPVFVGELHYVVPIGDFAVEYVSDAIKSALEESFLKEYRLYELFDYKDNLIELLANIGIFRDLWEETVHVGSDPFIKKYPGGWTFLRDQHRQSMSTIDFMTIEPGYQKYPVWSNSGSGALAAAIVQDLLHPESRERTYSMKGWTQNMEISWIERAFRQTTVALRKNYKGLWEITAPVCLLGEHVYSSETLHFVKNGRGR
jgi:hypothetical protein